MGSTHKKHVAEGRAYHLQALLPGPLEEEDRDSHMPSGLLFSQGAQSCRSPQGSVQTLPTMAKPQFLIHGLNSPILTEALAFLRALDQSQGGPSCADPGQRSPRADSSTQPVSVGPPLPGGWCPPSSPSFLVTPGGPGPSVFCDSEKAKWRPRPPSHRDPHTRRKWGRSVPLTSCQAFPAGVSGECGGRLPA